MDLCDDADNSIGLFEKMHEAIIFYVYLTSPPFQRLHIVLEPLQGVWKEIFNSDASLFGGSNLGNLGQVSTQDIPWQNRPWSIEIQLPLAPFTLS